VGEQPFFATALLFAAMVAGTVPGATAASALAIVYRIVCFHGGEVHADSEPGRGTRMGTWPAAEQNAGAD